jgi:hypothetical protein
VKRWFLRIDDTVLRQIRESGVARELMKELRLLEEEGPFAVDLQAVPYAPGYWWLMPRASPANGWEVLIHVDLEGSADLVHVVSIRPRRRTKG